MRLRGERPRIGWPAPTIRLRLTVIYGLVFLITGAVLLTIGYLLVRHNLDARENFREELRRLGIPAGSGLVGRPLLFAPGSPEASVANAVRAELRNDALHRLVVEYLLALGVMTMVSVLAGWMLAGRALRPLRDITATARRVSGENLGERIGLVGPADELRELADTFDGMLERLDGAFESQRHFVANASHELRTPLAIMRTEVDVALAEPEPDVSELRAMGEAVRETIDRCERLIEALLMLARSEAAAGREEAVELGALAADCVTDLRARAEEAEVTMSAELQPAWTRGDPALLERMIANLIENGIRHNEQGGHLSVFDAARRRQGAGSRQQRRPRDRPGRGAQADRAVPPPRAWDGRARPRSFDRALGGPRPRRHGGDPSAADRRARSARRTPRDGGKAQGKRCGRIAGAYTEMTSAPLNTNP